MEFTLYYKGEIRPSGNKKSKKIRAHKHEIRAKLHEQLKELWEQQPPLSDVQHYLNLPSGLAEEYQYAKHYPADEVVRQLPDEGRPPQATFAAVVWKSAKVLADLDITFLRPEEPGGIVATGGDIDNRLKTLLDALRIPKITLNENELPDDVTIDSLPDPFHCLLEDDSLVSSLSVRPARLLETGARRYEALVLIRVRTKLAPVTQANLFLAS